MREGLPLRRADWQAYLDWAVDWYPPVDGGVRDDTQIHTHMCYAEFNDIIEPIAAMDADVITIETSRSNMELLKAFEDFRYPNDIGPGVYDIHSPNVPDVGWMVTLMQQGRRSPAEGPPLGESRLRPEDPGLAGNRGRASQHGGRRPTSCARKPSRPRQAPSRGRLPGREPAPVF